MNIKGITEKDKLEREKIEKKEFEKSAEELAHYLLGKILCVYDDSVLPAFVIKGRIMVTEAYTANDYDKEITDSSRSQASENTQKKRGGHLYVKVDEKKENEENCRFDIVAGPENSGESVLIRQIDPYFEGPWISAWAMTIKSKNDGIDLFEESNWKVWLEDDGAEIEEGNPTPRKNVSKDKEGTDKLLRFSVKKISFK